MVTVEELRDLLNRHHFTLGRSPTGRQEAFSAKRHTKEGSTTKYIGTTNKLKEMSKADVLEKLNRPTRTRPAKVTNVA